MAEGRFEKCPTCGGSGIDDEDEPCPDCGGTGEVWSEDAEEPAIREPGARASTAVEPACVRDWLFSLLSLDSIAASQARAIAEAGASLERRAELRVIDGDK